MHSDFICNMTNKVHVKTAWTFYNFEVKMITTEVITDARRSLFLGRTVRRTMLVVLFSCKSREFLNRTLQGLGEISGFNLGLRAIPDKFFCLCVHKDVACCSVIHGANRYFNNIL